MADSRRDTNADPEAIDRRKLAQPSAALLDDPLGFIDAHHARERAVCRLLLGLVIDQEIERAFARDVASFLTHDLSLHHRDEDEDLFPLLLKRALPEDGLGPMLAQLAEDHVTARAAAGRLAQALSPSETEQHVKVGRHSADLARRFVASQQRHLAIETAIVMVMARKRLKLSGVQAMARSMKVRRGAPA